MARCLAAVISHAPGLSGTPLSGQRSSAVTSASCASSSASPTSRTMRARPAMSRGDSIRHTASMVRWMSVAVMATDHSTCFGAAQVHVGLSRHWLARILEALGRLANVRREVAHLEYLADLDGV